MHTFSQSIAIEHNCLFLPITVPSFWMASLSQLPFYNTKEGNTKKLFSSGSLRPRVDLGLSSQEFLTFLYHGAFGRSGQTNDSLLGMTLEKNQQPGITREIKAEIIIKKNLKNLTTTASSEAPD